MDDFTHDELMTVFRIVEMVASTPGMAADVPDEDKPHMASAMKKMADELGWACAP